MTLFDFKYISMKKKLTLTLISIVGLFNIGLSQETIFTDRPNVTDAVSLISPGTFQVEAGFLYESSDDNRVTYISSPNLSIKYGTLDWLELRVLANYQTVEVGLDGADQKFSGLSPITISPKIKIKDQTNWVPKLSLATSFTFPDVGEEAFQNEKLNYGYRILLENEKGFPWAASFGSDWDHSTETTWAYSWTTGGSFSDKLGFFGEIYGYFASDIPSRHGIDAGFTYLINNDLQADAIVGFPLNENAPDLWLGFGLAWKTNFKN